MGGDWVLQRLYPLWFVTDLSIVFRAVFAVGGVLSVPGRHIWGAELHDLLSALSLSLICRRGSRRICSFRQGIAASYGGCRDWAEMRAAAEREKRKERKRRNKRKKKKG